MTKTKKSYLNEWLKIGLRNPWIRDSLLNYDPDDRFTIKSFYECKDVEELKEKIKRGNWQLGCAFYLGDLCFINQINGGDEWLTIKQDKPFDSFTFERIIEDGEFEGYIARMQSATAEQCHKLEY